LSLTMIGLALGPYTVGRISAATGDLGTAILSLMGVLPISLILLTLVYVRLPKAEQSIITRARSCGEPI
jgi:MFS-type transporter involved in bile tolerance (Atg22 family)